ncbi:hypothetical protein ACP4OV_026855 [Aristida adscensionis]
MPPKDAAPPGGDGDGDGVDRISGLTDRALVRVLSHLPAWEAVRASLLSRRWRERRLWASLARLDIRQPCRCAAAGNDVLAAAALRVRAERFAAFVKNLLLRRRALQPIDALRLCWSHEARDGDAAAWIAHAARRGATEIELSAAHHLERPSPEYTSFVASGDVKTRLKILKLIHVRLDGAALTVLTSRCTCLEELQLTDCSVQGPRIPKIRSTSLKRLTMIRCAIPRGLLIYAPNLVSLQCSRPSGYFPWIENLGSPGIVSIVQKKPKEYPECTDIVSCSLKILKLSLVILSDADLTQLCSRCTSLQELELNQCSVEGKEIRSTSLKCLTMINCKFVDGVRVYTPNLVLLRCIRPSEYVPWIQHMGFLVTALIELDDSCLGSDHHWPQVEDGKEESDQEGSFFEGSNNNNSEESDHDGKLSAHTGVGGSRDDVDDYYDPGWSERISDDEDDDRTVCYGKIADELRLKPYRYKIHGCNQSAGGPRVACSEELGSQGYIDFGGDDMLRSLSNVKTMDLLAHPGEVLLRRALKQCPEFKNLTTLSLGEWCMAPDLDALATILDRSPNLENLFLHLDMAFKSRVDINPTGSSFRCTNLKMVKITCSKCDVMVHKLAEFLRANRVPYEKIFVCRTPCAANDRGGAGSQSKRKAETEAAKEAAKQRKADN